MTSYRRTEETLTRLEEHGTPDRLVQMARALEGSAQDTASLPPKVIQLGLALAYANRGRDDEARRHGEAALAAGLTRPEAIEALLAGVLSRGMGVLHVNAWIVEAAAEGDWTPLPDAEAMDTAAILEYFAGNFGEVPAWLEMLADASPPTLEAYYSLRSDILRDGALPRKHKELLLVVLNAVERYDVGMQVHMKGALAAGATEAELAEAMRAAIVGGGLVAWLAAASTAGPVLEEHRSA
ncbi:MAG: carboxymuconolactone decarboxylase family protein [Actinobacteria bacterium]|nr:carboxymuconolactone decarboxylase family protein [Actinomycetota bacterium]